MFPTLQKTYNQTHITIPFPGATIINDFLCILPDFFYVYASI